MSKWREDRLFEIMSHINNDISLKAFYDTELERIYLDHPYLEFFDKVEICYENACKKYKTFKYENL